MVAAVCWFSPANKSVRIIHTLSALSFCVVISLHVYLMFMLFDIIFCISCHFHVMSCSRFVIFMSCHLQVISYHVILWLTTYYLPLLPYHASPPSCARTNSSLFYCPVFYIKQLARAFANQYFLSSLLIVQPTSGPYEYGIFCW